MAKVIVKQIGGTPSEKEASTVGELKSQLGLTNHTATVNGQPATDEQELNDYEVVHFAQAVKGGM